MSRKLNLEKLTDPQIKKIQKDLVIEQEPSKYATFAPPEYICLFESSGKDVFVPFMYDNKIPRPERKDFSSLKMNFTGELREEQKVVKNEALDILNKQGSVIVSSYPGSGKCFVEDTLIMLYDGSVKKVQEIDIGEKLMGYKGVSKTVKSVCSGKEPMYDVILSNNDKFTCNETHILTLQNCKDNSVFTFTVKDYLKLNFNDKKDLKIYKDSISFSSQKVEFDPYIVSLFLSNSKSKVILEEKDMTLKSGVANKLIRQKTKVNVIINTTSANTATSVAVSIPVFDKYIVEYIENYCNRTRLDHKLTAIYKDNTFSMLGYTEPFCKFFKNLNNIPKNYLMNSQEIRLKLLAGIVDSIGTNFKDTFVLTTKNEGLFQDISYLCRSLGFRTTLRKLNTGSFTVTIQSGSLGLESIPALVKNNKTDFSKGDLLFDFKVILNPTMHTYFGFEIGEEDKRFLLGDFTVCHNTSMSIYISSKIGMRTLVIVHRVVLANQWIESIHKFCPEATCQIVTSKTKKLDCDFNIINAVNISKHSRDFYKDIGTVLVDEVHIIMAKKLSECMRYLSPRYLIGLSATPYRMDGLNVLFDMYFGKQRIERKLYRKHIVYKISTGFKPDVKTNKMGKVDWGSVIDSQCNNKERNESIITLIKAFPNRVFLVLCKRIEQANYLFSRLEEEKEDVTSLIGKKQEYEQKSRILIGTTGKVGVGFDHPRLDSLLLASDVEQYFVQFLGRVFRTKDGEPLIFDFVDDFFILNKHFKTRVSTYVEHGGIVKDFSKEFPNIKL
jgi:hypothetical protein